ncbi:MAG: response regulator [Campylobacteraceae bacterium]|nr:response regulator [Campylobacteraceae bacterium]
MEKLKIQTDLSNLNILIVEDGEEIKEIINKTFQLTINSIVLANNGIEAINMYNNKKPDIILTDLRMEKTDGNELIKRIRQKDKKIPIIVVTAYINDFILTNTNDVQAFIDKPINSINLIQTIDKCLIKLKKESK